MTLVIRSTTTGRVQQFQSLGDVPARHRWAFNQIITGEEDRICSGSTVYELRESNQVSDKYDYVS